MVDYDGAFETVIHRPWLDLPGAQREDASSPNRRGQLSPNAPDAHALHDTFHYQRGHADVFREVYESAGHVPPRQGERLLIVDIGAGAATVAVAIGEALGRKRRRRIDYVAFDPNPMMRRLGKRLLKHLSADFRSTRYVKSLEHVEFTDVDRLLFTFSYVSHQDSVASADQHSWLSFIGRAVDKAERAVELIYTTASLGGGALPSLGRRLDQAGLKRTVLPINVQVQQRYPGPASHDGRLQWEPGHGLWKVQAERWVLRA